MDLNRHEIPTHLNVEDRAFYGLSVRQVMILTGGFSLGYGLWNQWGDVLPEVRLALAVTCAIAAVTIALVHPGGRGCEEWAIVLLRYLTIPRHSIWQPIDRGTTTEHAADDHWVDLAPCPRWPEVSQCDD